jgi:hypothetical protein
MQDLHDICLQGFNGLQLRVPFIFEGCLQIHLLEPRELRGHLQLPVDERSVNGWGCDDCCRTRGISEIQTASVVTTL